MQEIFSKITKTVKKYHMLSRGDTVAVGVSGGADSMLLLHYLMSVQKEWNLTLIVAHVEHGIRGEASLADARFAEAFCKKNQLDFRLKSIHAPEEAKAAGKGVEEYSREVRYQFFDSLNTDKIATAHNSSDVAETVLFHLSRGSGLKGLGGIPPVRGSIIRPLIECSSKEIRDYCKEAQIAYITDETNEDINYTRNYIRKRIVPAFEKLNPSFEQAILRAAEDAREADDYLNSLAAPYVEDVLQKDKLQVLPPVILKRVLMQYAKRKGVTLDSRHLKEAAELVHKSGRIQLHGNIYAVSDRNTLRITEFKEKDSPVFQREESIVNIDSFDKEKNKFAFFCDYDKIVGNITVRTRLAQDKIAPAGRGCTKSLKKLYNELSVPIEERERIPVITDHCGVIGVYGYAVDDRVKIDEDTKRIYLLSLTEEKN